ncbi:hypothetical protein [Caldivirga sp.]|uniref:hypothetical protein n=1 Tax=Caldivirga sp. TaxID=2080243 RepID=UPI003D1502DC
MGLDYRGLINQVDSMIRGSVLRNLGDLESSLEGIVEMITETLNVEKPRVMVTLNNVNECSRFDSGTCSTVLGLYAASESVILVNYKADLSTLLHLLSHHLQALESGKARYIQIKEAEETRLPWEVRPLEANAVIRSAYLARSLPPRVFKVWNEEVKPMVKEVEEGVNRVKALVNHLTRSIELSILGGSDLRRI